MTRGLMPAHVVAGYVVACSRCVNEDFSYADDIQMAIADFEEMGWASTGACSFCPACEGVS